MFPPQSISSSNIQQVVWDVLACNTPAPVHMYIKKCHVRVNPTVTCDQVSTVSVYLFPKSRVDQKTNKKNLSMLGQSIAEPKQFYFTPLKQLVKTIGWLSPILQSYVNHQQYRAAWIVPPSWHIWPIRKWPPMVPRGGAVVSLGIA